MCGGQVEVGGEEEEGGQGGEGRPTSYSWSCGCREECFTFQGKKVGKEYEDKGVSLYAEREEKNISYLLVLGIFGIKPSSL